MLRLRRPNRQQPEAESEKPASFAQDGNIGNYPERNSGKSLPVIQRDSEKTTPDYGAILKDPPGAVVVREVLVAEKTETTKRVVRFDLPEAIDSVEKNSALWRKRKKNQTACLPPAPLDFGITEQARKQGLRDARQAWKQAFRALGSGQKKQRESEG